MEIFIQYLIFGITLAVSIGPVNIELIKQGVTKGFLPSWLVGIGGMAADFMIIFIIYAGLGAYFTSDIVQLIFGAIGSLMLIYMGFQSTGIGLSEASVDFETMGRSRKKAKRPFAAGFLLAIANPLNIVFWTGIYSSLLTVSKDQLYSPLLLIASIFIGISLANILFAILSAMGKSYVKPSNLRVISSTSGIVLIGYGLWMGYSTLSSKFLVVFS